MRIGTLNVHGWVDGDMDPNPARVVRTLLDARLDVIALQEATDGFGFDPEGPQDVLGDPRVTKIARALGCASVGGGSWSHANTVMTHHPIIASGERGIGRGRGGSRSVAVVTLATSVGDVGFASTHLDHLSESDRIRQFDALLEVLADRPAIVMGDFNAVRFADYSEARLRDIAAGRRRNDIEPLSEALMRRIDGAGWVDLVRRCVGRRKMPQRLAVTNHHGTRIDYIFATPKLARRIVVRSCEVVESDASDHCLVVVDIDFR